MRPEFHSSSAGVGVGVSPKASFSTLYFAIFLVADVEKKLLNYISTPEADNSFCNKAFLKTFLQDALKLDFNDLSGKMTLTRV